MSSEYQVDFVPYTETQYLSIEEKVNYILSKVTQRRILVLEKGLSPEEEFRLIRKTMNRIDYTDFIGIKLISFDGGEALRRAKLFGKSSQNKAFTIVAPDGAVDVLKNDRGILSIRIKA